MNRFETASSLMLNDNFSCSQVVLEVFCDDFDVDIISARKLSALMGGGMKCGKACGLVTGGLMALGLKYAQIVPGDVETKKASGPIAREFMKRFADCGYAFDCKDLLGVDLTTPEGQAANKEKDLHRVVCAKAMKDTIDILEDMLSL